MLAQRIMNATVSSVTKVSPSQLLYGNMITLDRNIFKSYKLKEDKTIHVYLKELLEIFSLLLQAKQSHYPDLLIDFAIRFDLANTLTVIQRTAERKNLSILEELSRNVLHQIFP